MQQQTHRIHQLAAKQPLKDKHPYTQAITGFHCIQLSLAQYYHKSAAHYF